MDSDNEFRTIQEVIMTRGKKANIDNLTKVLVKHAMEEGDLRQDQIGDMLGIDRDKNGKVRSVNYLMSNDSANKGIDVIKKLGYDVFVVGRGLKIKV